MRNHLIAAVIAVATAAPALAGPPMICIEFQCERVDMPLGDNSLQPKKGYNVRKLAGDTVSALDESKTVIQRMEVLRRSALYVGRAKGSADDVFNALAMRALSAEATDDRRAYADALFDAGYFAATLSNFNIKFDGEAARAKGVEGYAWITRAIEIAEDDAAMHFGASLATHPVMQKSKRSLFEHHVALAAAGAANDEELAKNLQAHMSHFGESTERITAKVNRERDAG